MTAHWSLGVLIGLPLLGLLALVLIVAAAGCFLAAAGENRGSPYSDWGMFVTFGIGILVALVVVVAVAASPAGYYPYKAEFHKWQPVSGQVEQVNSRLLSSGSGDSVSVNQRFVVKLKDHPGGVYYGCDDTRCSTIKVGDTVHLSCKREWQYASVSGYGCRWSA